MENHIAIPNQLDLIGESVKVLRDIETHKKRVKYATSGKIDYKYIPVKVAYAAPELLEALQNAFSILSSLYPDGDVSKNILDKIESAIKKAKQ